MWASLFVVSHQQWPKAEALWSPGSAVAGAVADLDRHALGDLEPVSLQADVLRGLLVTGAGAAWPRSARICAPMPYSRRSGLIPASWPRRIAPLVLRLGQHLFLEDDAGFLKQVTMTPRFSRRVISIAAASCGRSRSAASGACRREAMAVLAPQGRSSSGRLCHRQVRMALEMSS